MQAVEFIKTTCHISLWQRAIVGCWNFILRYFPTAIAIWFFVRIVTPALHKPALDLFKYWKALDWNDEDENSGEAQCENLLHVLTILPRHHIIEGHGEGYRLIDLAAFSGESFTKLLWNKLEEGTLSVVELHAVLTMEEDSDTVGTWLAYEDSNFLYLLSYLLTCLPREQQQIFVDILSLRDSDISVATSCAKRMPRKLTELMLRLDDRRHIAHILALGDCEGDDASNYVVVRLSENDWAAGNLIKLFRRLDGKCLRNFLQILSEEDANGDRFSVAGNIISGLDNGIVAFIDLLASMEMGQLRDILNGPAYVEESDRITSVKEHLQSRCPASREAVLEEMLARVDHISGEQAPQVPMSARDAIVLE
jgi:hypothetical protein